MNLQTRRQDRLGERISALGAWFHNIELDGIETAPNHFLGDYPGFQWRRLRPHLPEDLAGASVLDIGCNAGYFACAMKAIGAGRVVAIDSDPRYLAQARLVAEVKQAEIELRELSVYDVAALGERFDIVLCMGLIYHLRHPLLALDLIHHHVADDLLVFQSLERGSGELRPVEDNYEFEERAPFEQEGYPRLHFVEHRYAGDPTNWWIPNRACSEAMLRSAGFAIETRPAPEIYLCRRRAAPAFRGDPPTPLHSGT